jgi:hypothetical protein
VPSGGERLIAIYLRGIKNESKRKQENKTSDLLVEYRGEIKNKILSDFQQGRKQRKEKGKTF